MKVLIDGKEIPCHNDVKIIYEDEVIDFDINDHRETGGRAVMGELHIIMNCEGMITDTFQNGLLYRTSGMLIEDLIEKTH